MKGIFGWLEGCLNNLILNSLQSTTLGETVSTPRMTSLILLYELIKAKERQKIIELDTTKEECHKIYPCGSVTSRSPIYVHVEASSRITVFL